MPIRLLPVAIALTWVAAAAAQPVYKDRERFGTGARPLPAPGPYGVVEAPPYADPRLFRPPGPGHSSRPVNGGPGYVGSDYGLGKPAFTGLGTRPDWGRSE